MAVVLSLLVGVACAAAVAALVLKLPVLQRLLPSAELKGVDTTRERSWIDRLLNARRLNRLRGQLPEALMVVSTSVRAGLSLPQALKTASTQLTGPAGEEFRRIVSDMQLGSTLEAALTGFERRSPLPEVKLLVAGLKLARTTGGNLVPLLSQLVETLRERERLRGQFKMLTAQGRLSGWVVGLTPVALVGIMALVDPQFVRPLWTTDIGLIMLAVAVALEVLGAVAICAIVKVEP